jgi:hypothetical protein
MERLQGKAGWDLFHSKAVSVGRIEGALDGHFIGMRNSASALEARACYTIKP